jgi:hypothetical protein
MLTRLRAAEESTLADKMELPQDVREEQRRRRYQALHGAALPPSTPEQQFAGVLPIPAEATPAVPTAAATAASAFSLAALTPTAP